MARHRRLVAARALLLLAVGGTGIRALRDGPSTSVAVASRGGPIGSHAQFVVLSKRKTNRCDLSASGIGRLPSSARLQGACCSPMVESAYRRQARELRQFADIREIPRDA